MSRFQPKWRVLRCLVFAFSSRAMDAGPVALQSSLFLQDGVAEVPDDGLDVQGRQVRRIPSFIPLLRNRSRIEKWVVLHDDVTTPAFPPR